MAFKERSYHKQKAANAAVDNDTITPPAGKTFVIKGISFTSPAGRPAVVGIVWDGGILDAAQGDKFISLSPGLVLTGNGVKQLLLRLDNSANAQAAFMGVTIYYEEM